MRGDRTEQGNGNRTVLGHWWGRNQERWNSTRLLVGQVSREMEQYKVISGAGIKRDGTGQDTWWARNEEHDKVIG